MALAPFDQWLTERVGEKSSPLYSRRLSRASGVRVVKPALPTLALNRATRRKFAAQWVAFGRDEARAIAALRRKHRSLVDRQEA